MTSHTSKLSSRKRLLLFSALTTVILAVAWITYFLASFDLNNYRHQAEERLSSLLSLPVKVGAIEGNPEALQCNINFHLDCAGEEAIAKILKSTSNWREYLNEAQERFVKQRYYKNNNYRKGFEEIQKRTDDLKNLVISRYCDITPVTSYDNDVHRADIDLLFDDEELTIPSSDNYMFYVKAIIVTSIN